MAQRAYDVVIIGSGPGGYTDALYAARESLNVLVFRVSRAVGLIADLRRGSLPSLQGRVMGPEIDDYSRPRPRVSAEIAPTT